MSRAFSWIRCPFASSCVNSQTEVCTFCIKFDPIAGSTRYSRFFDKEVYTIEKAVPELKDHSEKAVFERCVLKKHDEWPYL